MLANAQEEKAAGARAAQASAFEEEYETYDLADGGEYGYGIAADTPAAAADAAPAAKAPDKKKRDKKGAFINQAVGFAPSANVTWGDDIDDEGA